MNNCPKCGSENPIYVNELKKYICTNPECEERFILETKPVTNKVFISYGHDEYEELALKIKNDLEKLGHEVWFDRSKLKEGRDWEIAIENGLKGTQIVIAMMTPYSMRRPDGYCLNELSMACTLRKEILPVMVRDCIPPLSIHRIQWLDFKEWPCPDEKYKEKFLQIRDVIEEKIFSFEGSHTFLLNELNPIDFKAEIDKYIRNFYGREWIFEEVKEWLYGDSESRVFFLTGKPGVGKTAISSSLCYKFPEVKAYHLVTHGNVRKSDAKECVLSLAYQLSTQISDYADKLLKINFEGIREKNARTLFDELIIQPLYNLKTPTTPTLIVIDALDEARKGDENELVSFLADTFNLVPPWLKLFITSRPEQDILNSFASLKPYPLDTEDNRNLTDIRGYVKSNLKEIFSNKNIDKALEVILERSEGIFLYVQEVLNELKKGRLNLEQPEDFPYGLKQVYKSFFKRQFPKIGDYKKHQRPLLELIAVAQEPLKVDLVRNILGWNDYSEKDSIDPLGSFLEIVDGKMKLFHKSILEWITDQETSRDFFISTREGHETLVKYGWDVYNLDVTKMPRYLLVYLPQHLHALNKWDNLFELLSNLKYVETCCKAGEIYTLIKNYLDISASENIPDEYKKKMEEFKKFLINQAHILRKFPHLTYQQAINQPDISAPSQAARKIIKLDHLSKLWFEWVNKQQKRDPCILTYVGHSKGVYGCVFSPDGSRVLSSSDDKTLKLWETTTGIDIRTFVGHTGPVLACAFSPDGKTIISASADNTLKLWDVKSGHEIRTLKGHNSWVWGCTFSPDGTMILSASGDATLRLWDVETGSEIKKFEGHTNSIRSCSFSPDGMKILSASVDKTLKIWNIETGNEIKTFKGHNDAVRACAFSPDGTKVLSASQDYTLKLWDAETSNEIKTLKGHSSAVRACAFSPDGATILSASWDGILKLWDTETGAEIRTFEGHSLAVFGCSFSSDGKKFLSASWDRTVKVWDIEIEFESKFFKVHFNPIWGCEFSPNGKMILTASGDSTLKLWDVKTGAEIRTFKGHTSSVRACSFSPDGMIILSASDDKTLKLWETKTGTEIKTLVGHTSPVLACAFSPDGKTIVSASADNTLKLWNVVRGIEIKTIKGHFSWVEACSYSPDGTKLISASYDSTLKLWDSKMGNEIKTFEKHSGPVWCCALSSDGKKLLSGSHDNSLKIWNIKTSTEIRTLKGHSDIVRACAFSSDGKKIISASKDATLRLWDAETGNELMNFPISGVACSISIGCSNLIAVGDFGGDLYILRPQGIDFKPAIVTPVRLYNFNAKSYNLEFSLNCKWCGMRFALDNETVREKSEEHPAGRLGELIECPSCHKSLKLTTFVLGERI